MLGIDLFVTERELVAEALDEEASAAAGGAAKDTALRMDTVRRWRRLRWSCGEESRLGNIGRVEHGIGGVLAELGEGCGEGRIESGVGSIG